MAASSNVRIFLLGAVILANAVTARVQGNEWLRPINQFQEEVQEEPGRSLNQFQAEVQEGPRLQSLNRFQGEAQIYNPPKHFPHHRPHSLIAAGDRTFGDVYHYYLIKNQPQ